MKFNDMRMITRCFGLCALIFSVVLYSGCGNDDGAPQALCRLTKKSYPEGSSETYTYNSVGLVSKIVYDYEVAGDPLTGTMTMQFDGAGKLTGATLQDNSTYTFGYDGQGRISEVEYEPGEGSEPTDYPSVTTYTYNTAGLIQKIQTELIREPSNEVYYYTYEYNAIGNLLEEHYVSGANDIVTREFTSYDNKKCLSASTPFSTVYEYGDSGFAVKVRSVFDPSVVCANNPLEYSRDNNAAPRIEFEVSYTYNEYGYPVESVDNFGNVTNYTYECL